MTQPAASSDPKRAPPSLDDAAFARLFDANYAALHIIASAHAGPSDADDVVQEAAMIALRILHEFAPGTSFRAWMAAIVRNVAANERRKSQRRWWRLERLRKETPLPDQGPPEPGPSSLPALHAALAALTEEQRCCLLLKVVLSRSYAEIAELLGVPEPTARSHVFRARKRMLELLPANTGGTP